MSMEEWVDGLKPGGGARETCFPGRKGGKRAHRLMLRRRPPETALSAVILGQFRTVLFGVARESGGSAWFLVGEDTISGLRGADDTVPDA